MDRHNIDDSKAEPSQPSTHLRLKAREPSSPSGGVIMMVVKINIGAAEPARKRSLTQTRSEEI